MGQTVHIRHSEDRRAEELRQGKRGEEELARTTARLNAIVTSAMDAIIATDAQQRVCVFNPAAERMFGVKSSEALGQDISRFIPEGFREALNQGPQKLGETDVNSRPMGHVRTLSALRAKGEEFPLEASISQVEIDGEKLYTAILRDITERKRAEEGLQRARDELAQMNAGLERKIQERTAQLMEANTNLQTFAYTAAHDLRAPLRSIRSFSKIVTEDFGPQLGPEGMALLERVTMASEQMSRLLDALLEYSKVSAAETGMEPVSLRTAVKDALALLETEIQAKQAVVEVEEFLPGILGHHASVVSIIENFLSNALKFVHPGVPPRLRVCCERAGDSVRLSIRDNGIGIEPKDIKRLFAPFQRLRAQQDYHGSGLGLAIVRKAAEKMRGRVGVTSEPGAGSCFWVDLEPVKGEPTDHAARGR